MTVDPGTAILPYFLTCNFAIFFDMQSAPHRLGVNYFEK